MATYTVTHPKTGKTLSITGDTAPTEQELDRIFAETGGGEQTQQSSAGFEGGFNSDGVPEWGRKHPNLYAGVETALDLAPMAAGLFKSTGVGIPVAAGINAGAKYAQRKIAGQDTTTADVLGDLAKGATVEGGGRLVSGALKAATDIPGAKQALQNTGRKLYQSAMKFSTSPKVLTPAERAAITETGLKYNFQPNDASYLRLKGMVDSNTDEVNKIINAGAAEGDTIPARDVLEGTGIEDLLRRGRAVRGVTPGYEGSVKKVAGTFKEGEVGTPEQTIESTILGPDGKPAITRVIPEEPRPYTPTDLNTSKRQLYQELEDAYNKSTLSKPSVQVKKQLARGLKETLETMYPEVKKLNENSAELLALSDHLARSMGRVGNRDVIGLGDKIVLDMVTGRMASPTTAAMGIMTLLDRPQLKARLAQLLYKANTGKSLPIGQWQKGLKYFGQVAAPAARAAFEGELYTADDPLGIRQ